MSSSFLLGVNFHTKCVLEICGKLVEAFASVNSKKIAETVGENSPNFRNYKSGGGKKKNPLVMTHDSWFLWLGREKLWLVQVGLSREIGIYPLDGHSL